MAQISLNNVSSSVTQKCMFHYMDSRPNTSYNLGDMITWNTVAGAINMPAGYGIEGDGRIKVPYSGVWLIHANLYYNSACQFALMTTQPKTNNLYGNANNFDHAFFDGNTQNGSLHATIAGAGGEITTSLMIPIYLAKDQYIWIQRILTSGNAIYMSHSSIQGLLMTDRV